jgi:probable H4MPT-linked C1 transfer pathway protein
MPERIGWDIGGAHVKAALLDDAGKAAGVVQLACPLWRGLEHLEQAVDAVLQRFGNPARHAVTMTGELADIFPNRHQGVLQICQTLQRKLPQAELNIYAGEHGFIALSQVEALTASIASMNWLASAQFVAQQCHSGVFLDIGSTTTDIVALHDGNAQPQGRSDAERLTTEELIYSGVVRTPVMAVVQRVPFNGQMQRVAAEHFATMADVYRLTGALPEQHDMSDTADGGGKTQLDSARRLARMVGRDVEDSLMLAWQALAHYIARAHAQDIAAGIKRVSGDADTTPLIGAGAGRFVVKQIAKKLGRDYVDFADLVIGDGNEKDWAAVCAPAYAVARLAEQT